MVAPQADLRDGVGLDGREVARPRARPRASCGRRIDALADHAEGLVEADDRGFVCDSTMVLVMLSVRGEGGLLPGAGVGPGGGGRDTTEREDVHLLDPKAGFAGLVGASASTTSSGS
jgi:hypothetical protein